MNKIFIIKSKPYSIAIKIFPAIYDFMETSLYVDSNFAGVCNQAVLKNLITTFCFKITIYFDVLRFIICKVQFSIVAN